MRLFRLFRNIQNLAFTIYNWFRALSINVNQVIAHWRIRISKQQGVTYSDKKRTGAELVERNNQLKDQEVSQVNCILLEGEPSRLSSKTSNSKKSKLYSLFRRLSVRNLMNYCVIALNEASGSSCSNKFDLTTCDQPVWLLGKQYELPGDADELVNDIRSKLWITYRRNFPPIDENSRYTTDRGFGCMIRCGQMVLANALLYKNLGRDWRWCSSGLNSNPDVYTRILKLFQDKEECPYSIHNIIRTGLQEGKVVGEWFGPNTIAQALKRIATSLCVANLSNKEILISVDAALDNVVVVEEIKAKFKRTKFQDNSDSKDSVHKNDIEKNNQDTVAKTHSSSLNQWMPGILFIQLRLGLTKINPLYFSALKKTFKFKNSLGITGGRPNHALYLIGYTGDDIIYLDPHSTQQYVDLDNSDPEEKLTDDMQNSSPDFTYHCACPEKMSIDKLDPSLALCFYFHTEEDFDEWCTESNEVLIKSEQAPMFEITKSRPLDWNISLTSTIVKSSTIREQDETTLDLKAKSKAYEGETFTNLSDLNGDILSDLELTAVDKGLSENYHANDDEEFEMLG